MRHHKLIELSEQTRQVSSAGKFWDICSQSLRENGVAGIGYGIIPNATDVQINGFSNAGFFKHSYLKEWETIVEKTAPVDNDMSVDLIVNGRQEILWNDDNFLSRGSPSQKLQSEAESDIGMRFGASIALDRSVFGQAISGIGLWVNGVNSDKEFETYWAEHQQNLRQICHVLDEGLRGVHTNFIVQLTPRERDCLTYLAVGLRSAEICWRLKISEKTFEKHIRGAKDKLRARTRDHAIAKALVLNLIQP